jgi:hypothetical protein
MLVAEQQFTGSCLCGALSFQVRDPKWCANCHCSMCRKIHGAAYVTWVGFAREHFLIIKGEEHLNQYRSSAGAQRGSCDVCGSQIFFQSERWPDEIHVTRASLSDEVDLHPQAHYFFDDRAPWVQINDALPRYGGPTGTEPIL